MALRTCGLRGCRAGFGLAPLSLLRWWTTTPRALATCYSAGRCPTGSAPSCSLRSAHLLLSLPDPALVSTRPVGRGAGFFLAMCICRRKMGAFPPAPMRISPLSCWCCACRCISSTRYTSARLPCSTATRASTCALPKACSTMATWTWPTTSASNKPTNSTLWDSRSTRHLPLPRAKIHSVHPIGLSVGLVPAYWWGLTRWENPRLASVLFMVLLASLCVPLIFFYLTRLGAECWAALLATGIMALTGPFFHYTNQLYPEIPALLIALITLLALAHWQVPGGSYRSLGRWEVPLLGGLTLLLCSLPFLHPRYTPLGLLCGAGVLLQAWHSPRRHLALSIVGLVVAAGLYTLITFHYAFSDDWMGPLRPGSGAWAEDALDLAVMAHLLARPLATCRIKASSIVHPSTSSPCSACWPSPACATAAWLLPLASMPLLPLSMVCTRSGDLVSAFLPASS